jgi:uncharacterized protein (TIGR03437 family)
MFIRSFWFLFYSGLAFAASAPTFPALTYSTYLRDNFTPTAIATDSSGNIYLTGNVLVDPPSGPTSVLVLKLNPQATEFLYERIVGGSADDGATAIAVDSAGNAYVAGTATSPDFPNDGNLATPPVPGSTERSFVFKLDPTGQLVFSDLLGGSTNSFAQAVAVNAAGQALVTGTSVGTGFPSTTGVYSVSDTSFAPFLLEVDPTGAKIVFSATGIGGNAIALDPSGNIYVAGTTGDLAYPLTPGTYQPTFPVFQTCIAPCTGQFQGPNQYATKLDPTGAKIIFSTAVSGSGNTMNNGLAVDAEGNVYLTGLAGVSYPYTVPVPTPPVAPALDNLSTPALPFLSKLDPNGQKLLFSVPVGGMGVQVDSNGAAYVGGIFGVFDLYDVAASLPALAGVPSACLQSTTARSAYVSQVDASAGNVLGSQFLGGSTLVISGVALAGSTLWTTGATSLANFPFTPNALISPNLGPNQFEGAYLGAVDFSQSAPPAGTPQIGCVVDAANLQAAGPIVPYQLLTIFGSGLGPATPVSATNDSTTSLSGVSVTFGGLAAPLLYVSSNQINVAVPLVSAGGVSGTLMQVNVNGVSSVPLEFPVVSANPTLFVSPGSYDPTFEGSFAVALNANGFVNSPTNPAQLGSVITVFVNGLSMDPQTYYEPPNLYSVAGWTVTNYSQENPFVLQVNLQVPSSSTNFDCQLQNGSVCEAGFEIYDLTSYLMPGSTGGLAVEGMVYVAP